MRVLFCDNDTPESDNDEKLEERMKNFWTKHILFAQGNRSWVIFHVTWSPNRDEWCI
jgi:hypothetical protein